MHKRNKGLRRLSVMMITIPRSTLGKWTRRDGIGRPGKRKPMIRYRREDGAEFRTLKESGGILLVRKIFPGTSTPKRWKL